MIININGKPHMDLNTAANILTAYIHREKGIVVHPIINNEKDLELFTKMFNIAEYKMDAGFYDKTKI